MINKELLKRLGVETLEDKFTPLDYIDTGSFAINHIVSGKINGGWPIGYIHEIIGESSTGKTVFLSHAFASAQKKGWYSVMLDAECTYDKIFAKSMGVDPELLIYRDPPSILDCFKELETITEKIRSQDKDTPILVGLDSMASQSSKELVKSVSEFDNMDGGNRAKEAGQCLRHLNPTLRHNKICLLLVNQIRMKTGIIYGNPETRSGGGKSLEYYCGSSFKIISNKTSDLVKDDKSKVIGISGVIRNSKNKIALPFQECGYKIDYTKGLDRMYGILPYLVIAGILEKNAAWYKIKSTGEKFQESQFYNGEVIIPELVEALK